MTPELSAEGPPAARVNNDSGAPENRRVAIPPPAELPADHHARELENFRTLVRALVSKDTEREAELKDDRTERRRLLFNELDRLDEHRRAVIREFNRLSRLLGLETYTGPDRRRR